MTDLFFDIIIPFLLGGSLLTRVATHFNSMPTLIQGVKVAWKPEFYGMNWQDLQLMGCMR
jgi:hypothetical protein